MPKLPKKQLQKTPTFEGKTLKNEWRPLANECGTKIYFEKVIY